MRKGFNTLNEEINRMKSLFTEERMFGNLVEQEKVLTEGNVLKMGSKGKEVEALQNLLSITPVDGDFGKITKSKVEEFQKNNGLSVDGVVGEKTLNVIVKKFAEAGNITNNQNESIIREQSLKFDKNNLNNLKILTKGITLDTKLPNPFQGNPFKGRTLEDIINDKMNQDLQKMRDNKGSDDGGGTDNKGSEEGGDDNKKSDDSGSGGTDNKGSDDSGSGGTDNKGSEDGVEKEKGMPGTESEGDSYDRGQKRDTIKSVLADIKADKGTINDNVSNCKKSIKMIYRQIKRVGSQDLNLTDGELKNLDWCVSTFKNRFGKPGFGVNAKEVSTIYRTLKREIPKFTGETVEKETYDVMMGKRKIAKVKMLGGRGGGNKFKFNGRKGFLITKKDRENDTQIINPKYEKYFLKSLGFGDDKEIVILRSDGNNGTFTIN